MTMIISKRWYFRAKALMVYGFAMVIVAIWFPDNPFAGRVILTGIVVVALAVLLLVFQARRDLIIKPMPGETED